MNPDDASFIEFATPTPDSKPIGIIPAADGVPQNSPSVGTVDDVQAKPSQICFSDLL